jgi:hypothetical protein
LGVASDLEPQTLNRGPAGRHARIRFDPPSNPSAGHRHRWHLA